MGGSNELLLGRIAVDLGFASPQEVDECIRLQQRTRRPLGQILVEKGCLTRDQLDQIVREQQKKLDVLDPVTQRRKEAILFGKLAIREGLVSSERMNECLAIQGRTGETRPIGEILVERGYLSSRQVQDLLGKHCKKLMICSPCRLRFTVITLSDGRNARCPRCKNPLEELQKPEAVATDAEFETQVFQALPSPTRPRPAVRTNCVVCESNFEAPPDETGRLRCPMCKSSFVPR